MESTSKHGVPPANPIVEFARAIQVVLKVARDTCGTQELEPGLERALLILQENPDFRDEFTLSLIDLIDSPREGVVEIISFLMHVLRWESVRLEIERRVSHPQGDVSNLRLYEAMLDAFSDSWRDRDLYMRFSGA